MGKVDRRGTGRLGLTAILSAVLLACAVFVFSRRRGLSFPERTRGGAASDLLPLLSPQGSDYVLLVSTPAVVLILNYEDRLSSSMRIGALGALTVIGFSVYDLMGRAAYGTFMALSVITVCYFVVIAAMCSAEGWKNCRYHAAMSRMLMMCAVAICLHGGRAAAAQAPGDLRAR